MRASIQWLAIAVYFALLFAFLMWWPSVSPATPEKPPQNPCGLRYHDRDLCNQPDIAIPQPY
jgi:hypothetical protein